MNAESTVSAMNDEASCFIVQGLNMRNYIGLPIFRQVASFHNRFCGTYPNQLVPEKVEAIGFRLLDPEPEMSIRIKKPGGS